MHPCGFLQAEQKNLLYSAYFVTHRLYALAVIPLYGTFITVLFKVWSNQVGTMYSSADKKRVQTKKDLSVWLLWGQVINQRFLFIYSSSTCFFLLVCLPVQLLVSPLLHIASDFSHKRRNNLLLLKVLPDLTVAQIRVCSYVVDLMKTRVGNCGASLHVTKNQIQFSIVEKMVFPEGSPTREPGYCDCGVGRWLPLEGGCRRLAGAAGRMGDRHGQQALIFPQ